MSCQGTLEGGAKALTGPDAVPQSLLDTIWMEEHGDEEQREVKLRTNVSKTFLSSDRPLYLHVHLLRRGWRSEVRWNIVGFYIIVNRDVHDFVIFSAVCLVMRNEHLLGLDLNWEDVSWDPLFLTSFFSSHPPLPVVPTQTWRKLLGCWSSLDVPFGNIVALFSIQVLFFFQKVQSRVITTGRFCLKNARFHIPHLFSLPLLYHHQISPSLYNSL